MPRPRANVWSTPERTASGPTDAEWTCRNGQFYHNTARQSRRRRPALPVPSPSQPHAARQGAAPGQERDRGAQLRPSPRTCRPGRTSRCRAGLRCRVHGPAAGRCGVARSCSGAGLQATARCTVLCPAAGGMCVRSRQVNFAGLWRTGKNTATAMAHATRTTRLRMAHDGSMRLRERAGVFSLFFFSAVGTERQA